MDRSQPLAPKSNLINLRPAFELMTKYNRGTDGFDREFTMTVEMASLVEACPETASAEALARFIDKELDKHEKGNEAV